MQLEKLHHGKTRAFIGSVGNEGLQVGLLQSETGASSKLNFKRAPCSIMMKRHYGEIAREDESPRGEWMMIRNTERERERERRKKG